MLLVVYASCFYLDYSILPRSGLKSIRASQLPLDAYLKTFFKCVENSSDVYYPQCLLSTVFGAQTPNLLAGLTLDFASNHEHEVG